MVKFDFFFLHYQVQGVIGLVYIIETVTLLKWLYKYWWQWPLYITVDSRDNDALLWPYLEKLIYLDVTFDIYIYVFVSMNL